MKDGRFEQDNILRCDEFLFQYCVFIAKIGQKYRYIKTHLFIPGQLILTLPLLLCQGADPVLANCWLSRRFICFLLLSSRTSSSSHPRAVMRSCLMRGLALQLLQSIILFDSYRDHANNTLPACSSAFQYCVNNRIYYIIFIMCAHTLMWTIAS